MNDRNQRNTGAQPCENCLLHTPLYVCIYMYIARIYNMSWAQTRGRFTLYCTVTICICSRRTWIYACIYINNITRVFQLRATRDFPAGQRDRKDLVKQAARASSQFAQMTKRHAKIKRAILSLHSFYWSTKFLDSFEGSRERYPQKVFLGRSNFSRDCDK